MISFKTSHFKSYLIQKRQKMGRSKARFYLNIVDIDTNASVTEQLSSSVLHYENIIELIESYNPEIDTETIFLYLKKLKGWEMFLEDDILNI